MGVKQSALWTSVILLSIVFVASGVSKLLGSDFATDGFEGWGYPLWFMGLVGLVETAGAVFILLPRLTFWGASLRFWGAVLLAAVLVGATGTHIMHAEYEMLPAPLLLLALLVILAVRHRPALARQPVDEVGA